MYWVRHEQAVECTFALLLPTNNVIKSIGLYQVLCKADCTPPPHELC